MLENITRAIAALKGKVRDDYTIKPLQKEHMQSAVDLFVKTFCDDEPITKHLGISYQEYEPFAVAVLTKAVEDQLAVVALDKNNKVIACTIGEDIAHIFEPNLSLYPKMEPIFALIDKLSEPFLHGKRFKEGNIAHVWIAMVDKTYRGRGLSTAIDMACTNYIASKGYSFAYAEFTNPISEKIAHHYPVSLKIHEIIYDEFSHNNKIPFKGVKGVTASYILGIKPTVTAESLRDCYY